MCAGVSLEDVLKLFQIAFYVVTPIIAMFGLRSWKQELRGRSEYEVATNVLAGAYRLRDAIKQIQAPFMASSEWAGRPKQEGETEQQASVYNSFYAFSNRYAVVREAVTSWYPHVVRGEALFGPDAKTATEALAKVANKLWVSIEMWHRNELRHRGREEGYSSFYNIMYGIDPAEHPDIPDEQRKDNGFHAEFKSAMSRLEEVFRSHLVRR